MLLASNFDVEANPQVKRKQTNLASRQYQSIMPSHICSFFLAFFILFYFFHFRMTVPHPCDEVNLVSESVVFIIGLPQN